MRAAYATPEAVDARDELMRSNPSAADRLAEGLEETLTLQELGIRGKLRRSFSSTNSIESAFSTVERICTQVKRWQGGEQRLRWVASALVYVESRWNRLHGHLQIPALSNALASAYQLRSRQKRAAAQTSAA